MHNAWTLYYKYPDKKLVASFVVDAELAQFDVEALDFSPRHLSLCSKATKNVTNMAEHVEIKTLKKFSTTSFKLRDVVLVSLDNADHTKVDTANLLGVIVSINKANSTCQVVVKNGLLHRANVYHALGAVSTTTNDRPTMDLEDIFNGLKGLPKITE